jgi:ABC-type uncharacterized transport system permease subunit
MNLFTKVKKLIRHNFLPQNIGHTMVETTAVGVWMLSTMAFYVVIGTIFPDLEVLQLDNAISIIATYFVGDGLMYAFLYRNLHELGPEIEKGKIENYLLLPTNLMKYLGFRNIQFASMIQIPVAILMLLIWGNFTLLTLLLWFGSMLIGFYLTYNIWLIISAISFWFKSYGQASTMYEEVIQIGLFPLQIYLGFKLFWPFLPLAFVASGGFEVLINGSLWVIGVQIGILFIAVLLRMLLWNMGLRKFRR